MPNHTKDAQNVIKEFIKIHEELTNDTNQRIFLNSLISEEAQAAHPLLKSIEQLLSHLPDYSAEALESLDKERIDSWRNAKEQITNIPDQWSGLDAQMLYRDYVTNSMNDKTDPEYYKLALEQVIMSRLSNWLFFEKNQINDAKLSTSFDNLFITLKYHNEIEAYQVFRDKILSIFLLSLYLDVCSNSVENREKNFLEMTLELQQDAKKLGEYLSSMLTQYNSRFFDSIFDEKKEALFEQPELNFISTIIIAFKEEQDILKEFLALSPRGSVAVFNSADKKAEELMNKNTAFSSVDRLCSNSRKVFKESLEPFRQNLIREFSQWKTLSLRNPQWYADTKQNNTKALVDSIKSVLLYCAPIDKFENALIADIEQIIQLADTKEDIAEKSSYSMRARR